MKLYDCPHCAKPGISLLRRNFLGPAFPATCRTCGRKIGVPWSSMLLYVPVSVVLAALTVAAAYRYGFAVAAVVFGFGTILMQPLVLRIPLIRR
jgi:hypothetical protein